MRNVTITLAIFFAFSIISCGSNNDSEVKADNPESNPKSETVQEGATEKITKAEFLEKVMNYEENPEQWVFEGDKPCIVDFYADWCAPCRMTSPILEELAKEYAGKINIYKVDTDKERELASVFGIRSIPSFLYCPVDGDPVMLSGIAQSEEETKKMFRSRIEEILLKQN